MKRFRHLLIFVQLLLLACDGVNPPGKAASAALAAGHASHTRGATTGQPRLSARLPSIAIGKHSGQSSTPAVRQPQEWTNGVVEQPRGNSGVATLREVRAGRNQGFDRIVFEFRGGVLPGYHVEYVDRPVRSCGSGHTVRVAGDGWLEVRLTPAQAHAEDGRSTVGWRRRRLRFPVLRELQTTCDFEAEVAWVAGVSSPNRYRVLELSNPARLVVDIKHGR